MEGVVILILIVVIVLLLTMRSTLIGKMDTINADIAAIKSFLKKQAEMGATTPPPPIINKPVAPSLPLDQWAPKSPSAPPLAPDALPPVTPLPTAILPPQQQQHPIPQAPPIAAFTKPEVAPPVLASGPKPPPSVPPPPPLSPGFFERNPDLEKFIGENLVSKIGIAILVIAIAFFVKYAIDTGWIGPAGRVGVGLLCGGILVGIAHRLRTAYAAFSSVLIGGGLAVFYFTIGLAYQEYHIFSQTVAFVIMIVITAFAVVLSMLYDRQEVAVIALVGGFCVPFIASNGSGNYVSLFIYLLLLNAALLVIAYRKSWRILNLLAFIFTVILFGGWLVTLPSDAARSKFGNGFIFATIFYLLFLAINIAHNVKQQKKFIVSDFGIILANTSLYFGAGLYMIYAMKADAYIGLFSGIMGAFNLVICFLLYRNKFVDKNVLYLLIGITLTFISLTIPLQLHGNYITLFWASECVLLLWLYQRSRIPLTHLTAHVVWVLMLISLLMDWDDYIDGSNLVTILLNKGFITTIFASAASYLLYVLHRKAMLRGEKDPLSLPRQIFLLTAIALAYIAGFMEINRQFTTRHLGGSLTLLWTLAYTYAFALTLYVLGQRQKLTAVNRNVWMTLLPIMILVYFIATPEQFNILAFFLKGNKGGNFIVHWLGAVLAGTTIYFAIRELRRFSLFDDGGSTVATWIAAAVSVTYISVELHLLMTQLFYKDLPSIDTIHHVFIKAGLPIIWGLCSFALMWLGMKHKYRPLRIISLTLFSITLAKLFIFDIQDIPVAGKIAAFFSLGVLLLVVSFMYQRLKKIIVADEPEKKD